MITGAERERGGELVQAVRRESARPLQRVQPQPRPEPESSRSQRPQRGQRHLAGRRRLQGCLRLRFEARRRNKDRFKVTQLAKNKRPSRGQTCFGKYLSLGQSNDKWGQVQENKLDCFC